MYQTIEPNPFRTAAVRPGSIPFHNESAIEPLAVELHRRRVGQIVGRHGSGKSTLVAALANRISHDFEHILRVCLVKPVQAEWRTAYRHRRQVAKSIDAAVIQAMSTPHQRSLIIVDGAEQMRSWNYWRFLRRIRRSGIACLLTSHRPLMQVPVLFQTRLRPDMIHDLTLNQVQRSSPIVGGLVRRDLSMRDLESVENLRDYWFELYDVVQPHLQPCPAYREQHCG